jgi:hypothetical protein
MRHLLAIAAAAACGGRAQEAPRFIDAGVTRTTPDAPVPADAPAPVTMLDPALDPWGPNAPAVPRRPAANKRRPPRELHDAPEPADASFVLPFGDRPRVRVHMPIGNWRLNRPILVGGAAAPPWLTFNPSWYEGNIDLKLEVTCAGACEARVLPANIVASAREDFEFERHSAHDPKLVPRWIEKPHAADGMWSWRFDASDAVGNRVEGRVAVVRIIPELGAVLSCKGETDRRAHPGWLDRLEALCRGLTFEVLP